MDLGVLHVLVLGVSAAGLITWAIFHYHLWRLLPTQFAETTPGKAVGFLFIPFFNFYWVFRSFLGVNRGLNRLAEVHNLPQPRANVGLATAAAVFFVVSGAFGLVGLSRPGVEDIESNYIIQDEYDLAYAYDDIVEQTKAFDILTFLLSSIPGYVLWLLMVLNQKRMVEHLLKTSAPVNTASGLLDT